MLSVTHLTGFNAGSSAPPVMNYRDSAGSSVNSASHTFPAMDAGPEAPDRLLVAHVGTGTSTHTIDNVTIGGVTASLKKAAVIGNNARSQIWQAPVPTGTTADVVVVTSANVNRVSVGLWSITGLESVEPVFSDSGFNNVGGGVGMSIDMPADGVIIAGGACVASGVATWSGVTERYDNLQQGTGGDFTTAIPRTARSVTFFVTGENVAGTVVCWR